MSMNGGATHGPSNYPVVSVAAGSNGSMTYSIVNAQNITFNPTNPLYIQAGTTKPTGGVDSQFAYTLSQNNTVLTLTDSNQNKGQYTYVMNFINAGPLDPIIENGGPSRWQYDYVWYAVGAALVVALLVLILRPKFGKPGPVERP
jgi:hypothetical protein